MFFETIRNSFLKSVEESGSSETKQAKPQIRRRIQSRISSIYNSAFSFRTALATYSTIKAAYDPYQKKQYADESGFDPYCDVPSYYLAEQEEEKLETYHDAQDNFLDETLPAAKRIRVMAASAIDSAAHTIAWGAMVAVHYVYTSVPMTASPLTAISATPATHTNETIDFSRGMNSGNESIKKKETVSMRGFGVDFAAVVERSPEMKKKMETVERHIRVLCLEDNEATQQEADRKRIVSCGGDQRTSLKRSIDDTWGFVERNYSINFKSTIPPSKPPRRVYVQPTQLRREVM